MAKTIMLYGRSRSGKTTQIGTLAEYVAKTFANKPITRLYSADKGGVGPIQPHIDLGLIQLVEMGDSDPFIFLNKACKGMVKDDKGKWVPGKNDHIGLFAFEGATSFADALMLWMSTKAGEGVNIGGGSNVSFVAAGDGETLKIGGSNMAHYGVCQHRVAEEMWNSMKLGSEFVLWTASVSKDEDTSSNNKVLGPAIAGKALTAEVLRWFNYTFRMDCLPAENGKPERHLLYLGNSRDSGAGNAIGLGNTRTALDAPEIKQTFIEPANLVQALELSLKGGDVAKDVIKKRLGDELLAKVKNLAK